MDMKLFTQLNLLVLSTLLLLAGCGGNDLAVEQAERGRVKATVVLASADGFPLFTSSMGTVNPYDRAQISTRVMGHVRRVLVEEGDRVKAGQGCSYCRRERAGKCGSLLSSDRKTLRRAERYQTEPG
jgi:multidrug efflux pump subunit AcrA (membrane-fusion protein)